MTSDENLDAKLTDCIENEWNEEKKNSTKDEIYFRFDSGARTELKN